MATINGFASGAAQPVHAETPPHGDDGHDSYELAFFFEGTRI
jgi:hypothetical protein